MQASLASRHHMALCYRLLDNLWSVLWSLLQTSVPWFFQTSHFLSACLSHIFPFISHSRSFTTVCRTGDQTFLQFSLDNTHFFSVCMPSYIYLLAPPAFSQNPSWTDIWYHLFSVSWWVKKQYQGTTSLSLLQLLPVIPCLVSIPSNRVGAPHLSY